MSQSLPVSRLVNVDIVLTPAASQAQDLSTLLVLGTSDVIDVEQRIRTYATLAAVAADFGTTAPEYLAAVLYFGQRPQPRQIKIGRWAEDATSAILVGGLLTAVQQAIATWQAKTTPGFLLRINGSPFAIAPATFGASLNLNAIAGIIQTALAAKVAGTTCVWNSIYQNFQIQVAGSTGVLSTVGFAEPSAGVGYVSMTGLPANNNTLTLNGTVITFKDAAGAFPEVQIGASIAITLANLLAGCQASADAQLVKFTYSLNQALTRMDMVAVATGVAGNALTLARVGANMTLSAATLAGGTAQDISEMLGMDEDFSGAYQVDGIAAETAVEAVTIFDDLYGQTWYALDIPEDTDDDSCIATAAYIEGSDNKHIYGITSMEAGILSTVSTDDIAYRLAALAYQRTLVQYSSSNQYAVASLLGRAITVDYNGNNTVITLMYKQEPGVIGEALTATQVDALEAKSANVFVDYNNDTVIIERGTMASGDFIDIITGCDWLAVTVMTAIYNLLYTSTTKIPQTDAGTHLIVNAITAVLAQAVRNGLLAPGVWNAGGFGILIEGDFLQAGFYVYAPPVGLQNQSDRVARRSVPIQIAAKLAGAVQTVDVTINVNQ